MGQSGDIAFGTGRVLQPDKGKPGPQKTIEQDREKPRGNYWVVNHFGNQPHGRDTLLGIRVECFCSSKKG